MEALDRFSVKVAAPSFDQVVEQFRAHPLTVHLFPMKRTGWVHWNVTDGGNVQVRSVLDALVAEGKVLDYFNDQAIPVQW